MRNVNIGILRASQIEFCLSGGYSLGGVVVPDGLYSVSVKERAVLWNGECYDCLSFIPLNEESCFTLHNVVIGVNFHWERKQNQTFAGELRFIIEEGELRAVNNLPVEKYLESVISSEMSATGSLEFLKAHTVISRSWLYAQLLRSGETAEAQLGYEDDERIVRWYARENHTLFDLCADDHCQRYQGITTVCNEKVSEAVAATSNLVLAYDGEVCDARFSKCCGGMTERFSACWEDRDFDYLDSFRDNVGKDGFLDLTDEDAARRWIESSPAAFCNTDDKEVLSQVLNGYDCETNDFYRWQVRYTQDELTQIIESRSGLDFGTIQELQPVERAASGRLVALRIVGTRRTIVVGKELEIRRWLSSSHLYSSAFVVDKETSADGEVSFLLKGAGWGHGVGLCQIGAAMMGERGYVFSQILEHYYPGAVLQCIEDIMYGKENS